MSDDSAFWMDLESRFRDLQPKELCRDLIGHWTSPDRRPERQWELWGAVEAVRVKFQWHAHAAAFKLGHRDEATAADFWLDLLRRDSPAYEGSTGETMSRRSKRVRTYGIGTIRRVCEASADYCANVANEQERRRLAESEHAARLADATSGRAGQSGRAANRQKILMPKLVENELVHENGRVHFTAWEVRSEVDRRTLRAYWNAERDPNLDNEAKILRSLGLKLLPR